MQRALDPYRAVKMNSSRRGSGLNAVWQIERKGQRMIVKTYSRRRPLGSSAISALCYWMEGRTTCSARGRCRTELRNLDLWRKAGFGVPRVVPLRFDPELPVPYCVLEYVEGTELLSLLADRRVDFAVRERVFIGFIEEWGRRHAVALARKEPRLVQEHATLAHVLVAGDRLTTFDLEVSYWNRRNIRVLIGREVLGCIRSLLRRVAAEEAGRFLAVLAATYRPREILESIHEEVFGNPNPLKRLVYRIDRIRRHRSGSVTKYHAAECLLDAVREENRTRVLRPFVRKIRSDAMSSCYGADGSLELRLPEEFIKEVRETLVWSAEVARETRIVFKLYRHLDLLKWWRGHLFRGRAEREYDRLRVLFEAGVRCCEPVVFARNVSAEDGRYELLGTREIDGVRKMRVMLESSDGTREAPDLDPLFETVRSMHAAGVYHGTLTPNNIVVRTPPGKAFAYYVIDLPRAFDFPYDLAGTRMAWCDLLHFVHRHSAVRKTPEWLRILDYYGFSESNKARFREALNRYHPTKHMRYRNRVEFGIRSWWAKKLGLQQGRPYPRSA